MAMGLQLYPPSVSATPRGLTAPSRRYWLFSVLVLLGLGLFLLFYLGCVVGSGYLVYLAFTYPLEAVGRNEVALKLFAIVGGAMLFLFFVKSLFKRQQADLSEYIEIREADQPELYAFIRRLCRELRAPFPHRIFLSSDVNAAVFYDTSLLNLLVPVRKNLEIGLGLVNVLTINEFKSVLAHEFGHFAQKTMALGQYVALASRVIGDMVFARDRWDDVLDTWRRLDFRLALFGWVFTAFIWVLRWVLKGVFLVLNLGSLALSREMEFHADRMAVSVVGSDAQVHALYKSTLAGEQQQRAAGALNQAALHQMYTSDFYYRQTRALEAMRAERGEPNLGIPPPLPASVTEKTQVFPVTEGNAGIWDSHPTHWEREQNAKEVYIRSAPDDRPAWLLFRDAERLREEMTTRIYADLVSVQGELSLSSPEKVQEVIRTEAEAETYDARYQGLFDHRPVEPGDVAALAGEAVAQPWPEPRLLVVFDRVYGGKMAEFIKDYNRRREEYAFLDALKDGRIRLRRKEFEFRGQTRRVKEVETLFHLVDTQLDQDIAALKELDRDIFRAHYQMAAALPGGVAAELLARYQFQALAQSIFQHFWSAQPVFRGSTYP